ncbi:MAG: phenylalanine--tRNA ligase subunit alpha [Candidatus Wallbacteria bacterium]|nr:phenylalanine--tRNA ligase subunit alpha [Candidatus Wallbacteria bacterium]
MNDTESLESLRNEALAAIGAAVDLKELEAARVKYLGRKSALLAVLREVGQLEPEKRAVVGKRANEVKKDVGDALDHREGDLAARAREAASLADTFDLTLPGERFRTGHVHPLASTAEEIVQIFRSMGFEVADGPEIETEYHNFEALNMPAFHPARDMQDTFFVGDDLLLRTHTSNVQIRAMKTRKPPLSVLAPGRVYRRDSDITHSPMFHQIEGFMVDERITLGHLKSVLSSFVRAIFGKARKVRFRPSYFPFVEPGAEMDVECVMCDGKGCRVCKSSGWLEILGAGMIHPKVLAHVGYDSEKYTGFAFGMGIERVAMLRHRISDIRLFFENDVRFLEQF